MSENVSSASKLLTQGLRSSVAVINTMSKTAWGGKGSTTLSHTQSLQEDRAGTREGTEAKPVLLTVSLSLFSAYLEVVPPTSG